MAVAEELIVVIRAEVENAVKNLNKTKDATKDLEKKFLGLITSIGASYLTFRTLKRVMEEAFKAAEYAAQVSQVELAFENMANSVGEDADKIIADLKRMSLGTIDNLNLIKGASRAALFDIPLDKLDELMKISMASATATGESVQYMFDSIVTGIGRASPLILDNLGLQLKVGEATEAYAKSLGKSAESLTMTERKQAILNAVLAAGGDIMAKVGKVAHELTDAQRVEQYKAAMADLRGEIGKYLLPAFREVTEMATKFVGKLKETVELHNIMRDVAQGTATAADELKLVNKQLEEFSKLNRGNLDLAPDLRMVSEQELEALRQRKIALQQQIYWEELEKKVRSAAAKEEAEKARQAAARAAQLQEDLKILREAYEKTAPGQKEMLEGQIKYWEAALKSAGDAAPKIKTILAELYDKWGEMSGRLNSTIEATGDFVDEIVIGLPAVSKEVLGLTSLLEQFVSSLTGEGRLQAAIDEYERLRDMPAFPSYEAIRHAEEYAGTIQHIITKTKELNEEQKEVARVAESAFSAFASAFAQSAIEGGNAFKEAMKAAIASVLEMLARMAVVEAAYAFAKGQFIKAGLLLAASTAMLTAAAGVRAMKEGGWLTEPVVGRGLRTGTTYHLAESGPELVVPPHKMGAGMGATINNYITARGSIITEGQLADMVAARIGRHLRGY